MLLQKEINNIASELNISNNQVQKTITLLEEGCTIPFIARYRKEFTGSLDEVQISNIKDLWQNSIAL